MKFPLNLNYDEKIIHEMGPWSTSIICHCDVHCHAVISHDKEEEWDRETTRQKKPKQITQKIINRLTPNLHVIKSQQPESGPGILTGMSI